MSLILTRTTVIALLGYWLAINFALAAETISCPTGTVPKGERMPDVSEAWCEKTVDGKVVMHGPYRSWWPNGGLGNSGQYIDGVPVGKWSAWYANGHRQGIEWFDAGKVEHAEYWNERLQGTLKPNGTRNAPN